MPLREPLGQQQVASFALGKITPEAVERLQNLTTDGLRSLDGGYPLTTVFENNLELFAKERGVLEEWLAWNIVTLFAAGVAAASDRGQITIEDLEVVRNKLCERFPECTAMRIHAASDLLRQLIESVSDLQSSSQS